MATLTFEESAILYIDSHHGVYIPQIFTQYIVPSQWAGISDDDLKACEEGIENEWYWDAWCNIIDNAVLVHPENGMRYYIYHNEDVWLIPEGVDAPEW